MCPRFTILLALAATPGLTGTPAACAAAAPPARTDRHGDSLPPGAVARLGTNRFRVPIPWCLAFSLDGKSLVSGGEDGHLHVWEAATGKETRRLTGHWSPVSCLALSPDGRWLATAAPPDRDVRLWDFATGNLVRRFQGHSHDVTCLAFSRDGKSLASGCKGHSVRVWEVATGKRKHWLGDRKAPALAGPAFLSVAFSPDGKYLAGGDTEHRVDLWDAATGKPVQRLKGHHDDVVGIAFSPDGKRLVSGSLDRTVRLWEVAGGKPLRQFGREDDPVTSLALSRDGKVVAAGTAAGSVHAWDTASGKALWQDQESFMVTSLAFSPDGKTLASASRHGIGLWAAETGRQLHPSTGTISPVSLLTYSPDGRKLAVAYHGQGVRLWDTRTWQEQPRARKPQEEIRSLRFGPKRQLLALTWTDRGLELWDVLAGKAPDRLAPESLPSSPGRPRALAGWARDRPAEEKWAIVAGDGSVLAATVEGLVRWEPARRKVPLRYPGNKWPIDCAALSPDGTVVAATREGLLLWEATTGRPLGKLGQERGVIRFFAFSPDGRSFVAEGSNDVWLWEVASGKQRLCLKGQPGQLRAAAFSPDGRFLALLDSVDGVRLWDLSTGETMGRLAGHRGRVNGLALSPDGKRLATGGEDTTVLVWDTGRLVPARKQAAKRTERQLEGLWRVLGNEDPETAYRAVWALADQPGRVEPFLKRQLQKKRDASPARIRRLIAELDSDDFFARQRASRELRNLGPLAGPLLRASLRQKPSLEAAVRMQKLLQEQHRPGPEQVRAIRALEVLTLAGTPEARRLLESFTTTGRK